MNARGVAQTAVLNELFRKAATNRDTKAINIKLDELLRAIEGARNRLADLGDISDDELDKLEAEFRRLARQKGMQIEAAPVALSAEAASVTAGTNWSSCAVTLISRSLS